MNAEYNLPPKNLYTMNPNKGWIFRIYKMFRANELPEDTVFIQSLFKDNIYRNKGYGKTLAKIRNKATRERLMNGNWEYDDDKSALFQYDAILDIFTNEAVESDEKYLSGDVSRKGRDIMPLFLWKGLKCYKIVVIPDEVRKSTKTSAEFIMALAKKEGIRFSRIILDEDGVGGGVVDNIPNCKGFINGSPPILSEENKIKKQNNEYFENYGNLKTQCFFKLAEYAEKGTVEICVNGDEIIKQTIIDELGFIKQKDLDKDQGKIYLVDKKTTKKLLGRSPDYADAMMMRMYFEVKEVLDQASDFIITL